MACPEGCVHGGTVHYSRWPSASLPAEVAPGRALKVLDARPGYYDYRPCLPPPAVEWHVNFADPDLFFGYGSGLFAQDEMMCAEHPALGAVREAVRERFGRAVTMESGRPTPVLVAGVERRCRVDTRPDAAAGRPDGLYGNRFAAAGEEAVRNTTVPVVPPTATNVLAMAAPCGGWDAYTREEIRFILVTAHTGFLAVVKESRRLAGARAPVAVHTGFWGCGAFGGNRVLMTLLQIIAAGTAGLDALVFHAGGPDGLEAAGEACRLASCLAGPDGAVPAGELVARIEGLGLAWGVGDGN